MEPGMDIETLRDLLLYCAIVNYSIHYALWFLRVHLLPRCHPSTARSLVPAHAGALRPGVVRRHGAVQDRRTAVQPGAVALC